MIPVAVAHDILDDQLARPVASDISTLPTPGVPHVILICPATSRRAHGVEVPIPILDPEL